MTARQFAAAVGTDTKWLLNSAALLRRRIRYTTADARWWGLVRLLTASLGLPLESAADAATRCLRGGSSAAQIAIADPSGSAAVTVHMGRYQSVFLANLSRALVQETPKQRGRPPRRNTRGGLDSALRYGVDPSLLRSALNRTPAERLAMLEANARFIREMKQRRRMA